MRTHIASILIAFSSLAQAASICASGQYELIPASQRPSTRNCETKGKLLNDDPVSVVRADSIDTCVQSCESQRNSDGTCVALGYNSTAGLCSLYGKRLIDMKYRQRKTDFGVTFSNALCYQCKELPPTCDPTTPLKNGGFEEPGKFSDGDEDSRTAADWNFRFVTQDQSAYIRREVSPDSDFSSDSIVAVSWTGDGDIQTASVSQELSCLSVGVTYQISFDFDGNPDNILVQLGDQAVFFMSCAGGLCNGNHNFRSDPVVATTANPVLKLTFTGTIPAEMYLDKVQILEVEG